MKRCTCKVKRSRIGLPDIVIEMCGACSDDERSKKSDEWETLQLSRDIAAKLEADSADEEPPPWEHDDQPIPFPED